MQNATEIIRRELASGPKAENSLYCTLVYKCRIDITYEQMRDTLRRIATAKNMGWNEYLWTAK